MNTESETIESKSWVDILREKASEDLGQLGTPRYHRPTLTESLQFILQVLDQGTALLNSRSITKLSNTFEVINSSSDYEIYSSYNELKTNTSLITVLLYLNYLLSRNVSSYYIDSLPNPISSRFKVFELPPLSKPEEFVTTPLDLLDESQKPENLYRLQLKVLELIDQYVARECQNLNIGSGPTQTKLILSFYELLLASILSTRICCKNYSQAKKSCIEQQTSAILNTALNLQYNAVNTSRLWVCLINYANDICYSDLRYINNFVELFESLLHQNGKVLKDDLVSSGLQFFVDTFKPDHAWFEIVVDSVADCTIESSKFKYLYSV
ncbi:hypothetical protein CORT_0G03920 [Candida orthopsilosis Co 90-125]|uniref:PH domain-containing protein n=1 Tax=Candida orthopsilosis (strain 90-125) TaxID=1136231 RepID=H8XA92_CANO9|nr:hypothetical protein CORT_0G03920 [Candida orthopsilosis Co 90-125]CCG25069.1 hypothetical protein CORT_0G03920 [Candida orthopsilosis Co 90-125]